MCNCLFESFAVDVFSSQWTKSVMLFANKKKKIIKIDLVY